MTYNGVPQTLTTPSPAVDAGPQTFSHVELRLGANRTGSVGEWIVDYDDVHCSIDP
jgi:hypothetical protein